MEKKKKTAHKLGTADDDDDDDEQAAAAEALRRQVFSNEKGFLESSAFNPARARAEREEEEARALAAQWGSTPERAKELIKRTKGDEDLSFQVGLAWGRMRVVWAVGAGGKGGRDLSEAGGELKWFRVD